MRDVTEVTNLSLAERDEYENALIAAGAVFQLLLSSQRDAGTLNNVEVVLDADGNATNQVDICLSFLASPYRLTVDRVRDAS